MKRFQNALASLTVILSFLAVPALAQETVQDEATSSDGLMIKHHSSSSSSSSSSTERGPRGKRGPRGFRGHRGRHGVTGPTGPIGLTGATGATGASLGGAISFGDFFALMPPDNAATVAVGAPVLFPETGPVGGGVIRNGASPSEFVLPNIGTYQITFQVSVTEAGQLMLDLSTDGGSTFNPLPETVVGRATGTSQIVGTSLVTTTVANSIVRVINPAGNSTALTITPLAGGTHSVSAHIVITQMQ